MRVLHGPGFRIYFEQRGPELFILPRGGGKRRQAEDIKLAYVLPKETT